MDGILSGEFGIFKPCVVPLTLTKKSSAVESKTNAGNSYVESDIHKMRWLNLREITYHKIKDEEQIVQRKRAHQLKVKEAKKAAEEAAQKQKAADEKKAEEERKAQIEKLEKEGVTRCELWISEFNQDVSGTVGGRRGRERREMIEAMWDERAFEKG